MNRFSIPILATALLASAAPLRAQAPDPPPPPEPPEREVRVVVAPAPESAPRRLTFGFVLDPTTPPRVARVLPGTPVEVAGVRRGDVLVRVAGETATIDGIHRVARATVPGDTIEIVIRRDGEEKTVFVAPETRGGVYVVDADSLKERARVLVERAREGIRHWSPESLAFAFRLDPDSLAGRFRFDTLDFGTRWTMPIVRPDRRVRVLPGMDRPILGLRITELNEGLAAYFPGAGEGILVVDVVPDSPAEEAGVEPGDVVVEVNGREVWNVASFHAAREEGDTTLTVVRRGERREIRIPGSG